MCLLGGSEFLHEWKEVKLENESSLSLYSILSCSSQKLHHQNKKKQHNFCIISSHLPGYSTLYTYMYIQAYNTPVMVTTALFSQFTVVIPLSLQYCLYVIALNCSRASKVFTNHQMAAQNGCLKCFAEVRRETLRFPSISQKYMAVFMCKQT